MCNYRRLLYRCRHTGHWVLFGPPCPRNPHPFSATTHRPAPPHLPEIPPSLRRFYGLLSTRNNTSARDAGPDEIRLAINWDALGVAEGRKRVKKLLKVEDEDDEAGEGKGKRMRKGRKKRKKKGEEATEEEPKEKKDTGGEVKEKFGLAFYKSVFQDDDDDDDENGNGDEDDEDDGDEDDYWDELQAGEDDIAASALLPPPPDNTMNIYGHFKRRSLPAPPEQEPNPRLGPRHCRTATYSLHTLQPAPTTVSLCPECIQARSTRKKIQESSSNRSIYNVPTTRNADESNNNNAQNPESSNHERYSSATNVTITNDLTYKFPNRVYRRTGKHKARVWKEMSAQSAEDGKRRREKVYSKWIRIEEKLEGLIRDADAIRKKAESGVYGEEEEEVVVGKRRRRRPIRKPKTPTTTEKIPEKPTQKSPEKTTQTRGRKRGRADTAAEDTGSKEERPSRTKKRKTGATTTAQAGNTQTGPVATRSGNMPSPPTQEHGSGGGNSNNGPATTVQSGSRAMRATKKERVEMKPRVTTTTNEGHSEMNMMGSAGRVRKRVKIKKEEEEDETEKIPLMYLQPFSPGKWMVGARVKQRKGFEM